MKNQPSKLLVFILGPTAVGKTKLSIDLAKQFDGEILSADSRQFYREMEIGTAKPDQNDLSLVKHHFINSLSITEDYNVSDFEKEALEQLDACFKDKDVCFMVGGSGLYLHAIWNGFDEGLPGSDPVLRKRLNLLLEQEGIQALREELGNLDPESMNAIDIDNPVRLIRAIEISTLAQEPFSSIKKNQKQERPFRVLKIGLNMERNDLYNRINERVDRMIEAGLVEEAKELHKFKRKNALKTVGYQELFRYFEGDISLDEAIEKIKVNSRRYAKRQLSWFNRYKDIEWFENKQCDEILSRIKEEIIKT